MSDPNDVVIVRAFQLDSPSVEVIETDREDRSGLKKLRADEYKRADVDQTVEGLSQIVRPRREHRQSRCVLHIADAVPETQRPLEHTIGQSQEYRQCCRP